jgi:hypothetical protein
MFCSNKPKTHNQKLLVGGRKGNEKCQGNWHTNLKLRANMGVPLELNFIGVRHGLKGYTRKSSTFSLQADVVGLSAFFFFYR